MIAVEEILSDSGLGGIGTSAGGGAGGGTGTPPPSSGENLKVIFRNKSKFKDKLTFPFAGQTYYENSVVSLNSNIFDMKSSEPLIFSPLNSIN
jgi:hypothetical protein